MKALASEIVRKLSKRLKWLSIEVRELTGELFNAYQSKNPLNSVGDMQLTKAEIARTQIIVTTPEKWDVVTRKPTGEGELASVRQPNLPCLLLTEKQILKLLIIDEVHLLNDERGAVIETIVARTLRQVESSQSMIRIVGLSATLPNYKDVASFLWYILYFALFHDLMTTLPKCLPVSWSLLLRLLIQACTPGATLPRYQRQAWEPSIAQEHGQSYIRKGVATCVARTSSHGLCSRAEGDCQGRPRPTGIRYDRR